MYRRILSILIAAMFLLPMLSLIMVSQPVMAQETVGPKTDTLIYKRYTLDQVKDALDAGDIDVYLFGVPPSLAVEMQDDPNIAIYTAPAGLVNFIFNPSPVYYHNYTGYYTLDEIADMEGVPPDAIVYYEASEEGGWTYVEFGAHPDYGINPFAFREIRFAMNYAFDRDTIVTAIYNGFAVPMYTFLSPYDPDYATIADIIAKYRFGYDLDLANRIISEKLVAVGAEMLGTYWYYNGERITLKFIIRTEDERRQIGDNLATNLVRLGFDVQRLYLTFGEAITRVYASNPYDFQWHIYTEGWGKGGIDRYDYGTINQFGAPWYGWMPGFQVPGWWSYHNKTIDEVCQKIFFGEFSSKEERDQLYKEGTELIIQESVRVWVVTRLEVTPTRSTVRGLTMDLGAGLRGIWNPREWYAEDHPDTMTIGHLWVMSARTVWNPYGGFSDVYSVDIERATYDPFMWAHPFNGEPIPFRTTYTVETAGPDGTLPVPSDALVWDAESDQWVTVGDGVTAKSYVVFNLSKVIGTKWHHGIEITWADVISTWAYLWELSYDTEKSTLEAEIASPNQAWLDTIRGLVFDTDNNLMIVYVDYWHFDPNYIAYYAVLSTVNPVELIEAMFSLAFDYKTYALSETRAEDEGIPQLNLVLPDHAADVEDVLETFVDNTTIFNRVNAYCNGMLTMDEWNARVQAAIDWIDPANLRPAWISDGAYMLVRFDPDLQEAELHAFRDPTYPFKPGDWLFGTPTTPSVTEVDVPIMTPGQDVEITVQATGPGSIKIIVMLYDPVAKQTLYFAELPPSPEGVWTITLPSDVTAQMISFRRYEFTIMVISDQVAVPGVHTEYIEPVSPSLYEQLMAIQTQMQALQEQLSSLSTSLSELANQTAALIDQLTEQLNLQISLLNQTLGAAVASSFQQVVESINTLAQGQAQTLDTLSNLVDTVQGLSDAQNNLVNSVNSLSQSVDQISQGVAGLASSEDVSDLKSSVEALQGTVGTVQILEIVVLILVLIAIAIPFVKRS